MRMMELVGCNQKRSRPNSEAERCNSFCNLTDELVIEILLRLPIKCSIRCKAVCKRLRAIISDGDYFIRSFIHNRHQIHSNCADLFSLVFQNIIFHHKERPTQIHVISENLILRKWGKGRRIDMSYIPGVARPLPFKPVLTGPLEFQLEASFADLLLCSYNNPSTLLTVYYICNIVTRQWVALPPIPMDSVAADVGLLCDFESCLECSNQPSSGNFYKFKFWLVRIPLGGLHNVSVHAKVNIYLFSSEEDRWTDSVVSLPRVLKAEFEKSHMIAYHGMLHRLTRDGIIVFDPTKQQVVSRIIDLPPKCCWLEPTDCFGVTRDRLRISKVHCNEGDSAVSIWELEDYINVKWRLAFRISTERTMFFGERLKQNFRIMVLAFHPYRRRIFLLNIDRFIVLCYCMPQKKKFKFEVLYGLGSKAVDLSWVTAFPLVYNWWPTPVPSFI